ncbi:salivary peroxidase/catechol oxidase-like isoform X2 [Tachypleus tridentatus]|uniref:salivary peroxidase/catechol oxidase-like isoform X2 n=1 Tax=Tachypleus tridentatus TaxID=6853 RepID=UPI003FD20AF7
MKRILSNLVIVLFFTSTFTVHGLKKRKKRQDLGFDAPVIFPEQSEPLEEVSCTTSKGAQGTCKHLTSCVFTFDSVDDLETSTCRQSNNDIGICCADQPISSRQAPISISIPASVSLISTANAPPQITSNDLDDAGKAGQEALVVLQSLELELKQLGLVVERGTATSFHQAFFGRKNITQQLGNNGFVGLRASETLAKRLDQNVQQITDSLSSLSLKGTVANSVCPIEPPCPSTKYRTIDGSCNNLRNPTWGKSFTAFNRILRPDYADGLTLPRIASDGGPLPSARDVSVKATPDANKPHRAFTLLIMQFAQFLDHDLTLVGLTKANDGSGILCCKEEIQKNPRLRHPACLEISISKDDPFFSKHGETCMEFVRSLPSPRPLCSLGSREQLNQLTAFIDASNVYGSTKIEEEELRQHSNGLLRVSRLGNVELLPKETDQNVECEQSQANNDFLCFKAGDERANEQVDLAVLHTIWMREHNRVARVLAYYNPGWNDEILYQESRRIVGAEMQHIVFNEFLPLLLGRGVMSKFNLLLKRRGHSTNYDPTLNPGIANAFGAAAYRYGHTLVQGTLDLIEKPNKIVDKVSIRDAFFNPSRLYEPGNLDHLLRGLVRQPSQRFDSFVTNELTNHLFQPPGKEFGMDLVALNIQRGRDHGLPGYNAWREHCGLPKAQSFDDLIPWMNPNSISAFKSLYRNVNDIDLFPAGIAEYSIPYATLGPTFACIVADQFRRLKLGDRLWYENGNMESSFTEPQLAEIRKSSLARIICDNSDMFEVMQPFAFLQPNPIWNPLVSCNSTLIPRLYLGPWRNEPVWS